MEFFNLMNKKVVVVENDKATVFDPKEVESELTEISKKIDLIPSFPTDEELLKWAKENYPVMNYSVELNTLTARKDELQRLLEAVK